MTTVTDEPQLFSFSFSNHRYPPPPPITLLPFPPTSFTKVRMKYRPLGLQHRVGRVLSFSSVVGIGTPPPPLPQANVSDKGTYTVVLCIYMYVLCGLQYVIPPYCNPSPKSKETYTRFQRVGSPESETQVPLWGEESITGTESGIE